METIDLIALFTFGTMVISIINLIKINKMALNTEKALEDLALITTKLQKIGNETAITLQKVKDLEDAAANSDTPQSVLDAIAAVKEQAQVVDDLTPDAEPIPE